MGVVYSDQEVAEFLSEPKALPPGYRQQLKLRQKRGHREYELDVTGVRGSSFRVILRQSNENELDFSVILAVCPPTSTRVFRLRRYNGKSIEHSNKIEGTNFYDFHIHQATQRYQEYGWREDAYAEPTERYGSIWDAFSCLLEDCGFIEPDSPQPRLVEVT